MNSANNAAVVVGVDGSEPALRAVRLAATEAARRQRPLRVVHGFIWPLLHVPVSPAPDAPPGGGLRHQAEELVEAAVAEAEATVPGLSISGEIIDGEAAAVLVGESPTAALIVLGDRGLGGFSALVVGSVAVQVAAYADCPVLVARGDATTRRAGRWSRWTASDGLPAGGGLRRRDRRVARRAAGGDARLPAPGQQRPGRHATPGVRRGEAARRAGADARRVADRADRASTRGCG